MKNRSTASIPNSGSNMGSGGQTHKSSKPSDNGGAQKVARTTSVKTSKPSTGPVKR